MEIKSIQDSTATLDLSGDLKLPTSDEIKEAFTKGQKKYRESLYALQQPIKTYNIACPKCKRRNTLKTRAAGHIKKCSCKACGNQIRYFHTIEGINVIEN